MALPINSVVMPTDLRGVTNGKLPASLLQPVHGGGQLHHLAARAFNALVDAAWKDAGLALTYTYGGTFRSYAAQETLFRSRYTPNGPGGGCKTWNGVRWCKKSTQLATAATPGTSNHGWGLAIDTAYDGDLSDGVGPDDARAITSHPGWPWLLTNARRFGFSWELQSEPWHIRYVTGDTIPVAVLEFEKPPEPAKPDPIPPQEYRAMSTQIPLKPPVRIFDTRGFGGPIPAGQYGVDPWPFSPTPAGAVAVEVGVKIHRPVSEGYATVWAGDIPTPDVSSHDYFGALTTNIVMRVPLAADGTFKVYMSADAGIIVDLYGYWT